MAHRSMRSGGLTSALNSWACKPAARLVQAQRQAFAVQRRAQHDKGPAKVATLPHVAGTR